MPSDFRILARPEALIRRNPVLSFFALTFLVSWTGALAIAAPHLIRHEPVSHMTRILMFPVMLLGPSLAGVVLTRIVEGKSGLRVLVAQLFGTWVTPVWYTPLLIPPALILMVLVFLQRFVSPVYAPNYFFMGILFGIPAGFLEEIGWMGYAFPKMRSPNDGLAASILLGLLWSLWHLPVIDHLGAATPHGIYWLPFFLAFSLAMTAMRVLIAWIYTNTKSLLLAQLMHVSSTGSLVLFGAARVTAAQEAIWYALYGILLWIAVAIIIKTYGRGFVVTQTLGAHSH